MIPVDQKAILQPDLPGFIADTHFGSVGATLMGGVVAAVVAAAFAIPLMRLNGIAAGLATFAMLVIIRTVANSWTEVTNGAAGLSGIPGHDEQERRADLGADRDRRGVRLPEHRARPPPARLA